jgi:hypothetical protein
MDEQFNDQNSMNIDIQPVYTNTSFYKEKNIKIGDNINNKINTKDVANEFVKYFYNELKSDYKKLIKNNILREYTKIGFNENIYTSDNIIPVFDNISKENYNILKIESIDSGSRAININVVGMKNLQVFSHSFLICHDKLSSWYLKNIIFI